MVVIFRILLILSGVGFGLLGAYLGWSRGFTTLVIVVFCALIIGVQWLAIRMKETPDA